MTSRVTSYNATALDEYANQLAGQIYLPDEQCEIIDGAGSYLSRVRYIERRSNKQLDDGPKLAIYLRNPLSD